MVYIGRRFFSRSSRRSGTPGPRAKWLASMCPGIRLPTRALVPLFLKAFCTVYDGFLTAVCCFKYFFIAPYSFL